jgi:tetratricopeptide (TPR) repeat protein
VGNTWKLIDVPAVGSENQRTDGGFFAQVQASPNQEGENSPSDEMQKLMAEYERLDRESDSLSAEKLAENVEKRVEALQKLADVAPANNRDDWYRQMIDVISVAIQSGNFPQGVDRLAALQKKLEDDKADEDLIAHAVFQNMWAQFAVAQHAPNSNMGQLQTKWLADLEGFVKTYPKSVDTAEALLQLGMYQDLMGNAQDAIKWYQQLVSNFPKVKAADRASGALTRLNSMGRPITIRGKDMMTNGTVDLSQFRGKAVLVQYWASWSEPSKADMAQMNNVYSKRGGRTGDFEIISICLDDNPAAAKLFLTQNKYPWKNIYEPGGLESRLANEMGVMTVPLMLLVDPKGTVVNQNVHAPELEAELAKLQPAAPAGAANALRSVPPAR